MTDDKWIPELTDEYEAGYQSCWDQALAWVTLNGNERVNKS